MINNDDEFARGDRELTLSTGAILGLFLGLALLCALFFGFGYKMGSRNSAAAIAAETSGSTTPAASTANFSDFKPAAGSPAGTATPHSSEPAPPAPSRESAAAPSPAIVPTHSALAAAAPPPARSASPTAVHLGTANQTAPAAASTGNFIVQIAAVSLQEDANLLVNALRSKGYVVSEHAESDKLIHIQVGPFATRAEANAMRQRLLGDGYNAIVK